MNKIIENSGFDFGPVEVETSSEDRLIPDLVVFENPRSQKLACVLEAKRPIIAANNYFDLVAEALKKARHREAPFFATLNFRQLFLYQTDRQLRQANEYEYLVDRIELSDLEDINDINLDYYKTQITKGLESFIYKLYKICKGEEPVSKLPVDKYLVGILQDKINSLSKHYAIIINNKVIADPVFEKKLKKWLNEQQWSYASQFKIYELVARQVSNIFINKLLFYAALQSRKRSALTELDRIRITNGDFFEDYFKNLIFKAVLRIDYENIYAEDFTDEIIYADNRAIIGEVQDVIQSISRHDFANMHYDIIGKIFEQMIPVRERHKLGQYFTSPDIVDLILNFCLKNESDTLLDPSCGTGAFLVRAYLWKRIQNMTLEHDKLLNQLWGVDVAKYPTHLATINLALKNLDAPVNYPNIIHRDFFKIEVTDRGVELPQEWLVKRAEHLNCKIEDIEYPVLFDCITGNPPYIRQEEIGDLFTEGYKENVIGSALNGLNGKPLTEVSKRAGIHAYFFVHGYKMLKEGGRFGFIVPNSWLDVEYGKDLQKFFLKHFKIVAILESRVERWFDSADVNTCVVILEKCSSEQKRNDNLTKFVYIKQKLSELFPKPGGEFEEERQRAKVIAEHISNITYHDSFYENDLYKIYPQKQSRLWDEGYDRELEEYNGSKWGKYLRAPAVYFEVLNRFKDKFIPLGQLAEVKFGLKTGANQFFYLTDEEIRRWNLEKKYWMHQDENGAWVPNYVVKSPRECKAINVREEDLQFKVLMIHDERKKLYRKNIYKYIKYGERDSDGLRFNQRPTTKSRSRWWDLGEQRVADLFWIKAFYDRFLILNNNLDAYISDRFYPIYLHNKTIKRKVLAILNSTLQFLFIELNSRVNLGEGALDNMTYEAETILVLNPDLLLNPPDDIIDGLCSRETYSIFKEIGAYRPEDVTLDKVQPDRRRLDEYILGTVLGLSGEEQLEIYKSVIELVGFRLEKAKSVNKILKTGSGIDVQMLVTDQVRRIGGPSIWDIYLEKVWTRDISKSERELFTCKDKPSLESGLFGYRVFSRDNEIICNNEYEARYFRLMIEFGFDYLQIPDDEKYLQELVLELEGNEKRIKNGLEEHLTGIIDRKMRDKVYSMVISRFSRKED